MGLAYVMTLAAQRHDVILLDRVGRDNQFATYLYDQIRRFDPHVIGFSVNSFTMRSALVWSAHIKKTFPHVLLLFGGVHPTILPEETLSEPLVDMVCIGEAEYTVLECLDALAAKKSLMGIEGLWFKDEAFSIVRNPLRPFVENLDSLPFPNWDLWDIQMYINEGGLFRNSLKVLASRGCMHDCQFCTAPIFREIIPGTYYRLRSASNVISEIERNLDSYGSRGLRFTSFADPLFGADQKQFDELMRLYKHTGLAGRLPWICETRPEVITDEWASKAYDAGCMAVSLGVESGTSQVRQNILGKKTEDAAIKNALTTLERLGIAYILYLILCAPSESLRAIGKTVLLSLRARPLKTYFLFFLPLPKTPIYEKIAPFIVRHRDTRFDDGYWNRPNIAKGLCDKIKNCIVLTGVTVLKTALFIKTGWRLRRKRFLCDVYTYIADKKKRLPLVNPYAQNELYQNTIMQYFLDDHSFKKKKSV
jgi:anaerobic magnesium-protoporphyrin IX monomethyl ester cyclase